jgi:chorismate mutase / prephenate dehydratase
MKAVTETSATVSDLVMNDVPPANPSAIRMPELTLADVRKEIDAIDDAIVDLLAKRFDIVTQVRAIKAQTAAGIESPLRPAREAKVLSRLVARAGHAGLNPHIPVLLWPLIMAEAALVQADIEVVMPVALAGSTDARLAVQRQFGRIPVIASGSVEQTLGRLSSAASAVAVLACDSPWVRPFLEGAAGEAQVIWMVVTPEKRRLLVLAKTAAEPTGRDETLIVGAVGMARGLAIKPNWAALSEEFEIIALPGYLSGVDMTADHSWKRAGRYPLPVDFAE